MSSEITNNSYIIQELKRVKRTLLALKNGVIYSNEVLNFIEKEYIDINNYDAILTTFGPVSSVLIGLKLKEIYPSINWICDFRDSMNVKETSILLRPFMWYLQQKACKKADHIVAVSNGYIERICGDKYTTKRHMIPNGYDKSDLLNFQSQMLCKDKLHITYVGALYEGKRKISPLFKVIRELIDENLLSIDDICFDYAGRDSACLYEQANYYNLKSVIVNHGLLSRQECLVLFVLY